MRQNDPDVDETLEQALASYADPADAGQQQVITARIMSKLETAKKPRWYRKPVFIFLVPELALLLLGVVLLSPHRAHDVISARQTIVASSQSTVSPHTPQTALRIAAPVITHPVSRHNASTMQPQKHLPKLDQFPAPAPLSSEERRLIYFAAHTTADTQQKMMKAQQQSYALLHIAELDVPLIESHSQPE
jgi:hypothetical protein